MREKICVSWFSAGVSSAVATYLALDSIDRIVYTHIEDQHEDTLRFVKDCETWFRKPIEIISSLYRTVEEAVGAGGSGFINGPHGAICSRLLKRRVRKEWENEQGNVKFTYVWGMDSDETKRAERLRTAMPNQEHVFPLIANGITKEIAHKILRANGIRRPTMYDLGYPNNNCVGCVKGGMGYWNKIRVDFPDVFANRARMEREVGGSCINGVYLDELDPTRGRKQEIICDECGIFCEIMNDQFPFSLEGTKMSEFEKYYHHGTSVWVKSDLKGTHREHCLCFSCRKFTPERREESCKMANLLYAFCCAFDMTTPVFECPEFIEKENDNV